MSLTTGLLSFLAAVPLSAPTATTLESFQKALSSAQTLQATVAVQPIGGFATQVRMELQKPNKARIDTRERLIVADGTHIFELNKTEKLWAKRPQTDAELAGIFKDEDLAIWAPFFSIEGIKPVRTREAGSVTRAGMKLNSVELLLDNAGTHKLTLFLDADTSLVRQAQIEQKQPDGERVKLLQATKLTVGQAPSADAFAWNAPEGNKEVTWDEFQGPVWLTNLDEALRRARAQNKPVYAHFTAVWCGPCRRLEAEVYANARFRAYGGRMILLKIDVDQQPSIARRYQVEAMPTQMLLTSAGAVITKTVGYGGPEPFYRFLDDALRMNR
jgi:thiol-disulfide isomerase/thioredoxin